MPVNSITGERSDVGGGAETSPTAFAIGAAGTVPTAGLDVSRLAPAAARTGCILQAGTFMGQQIAVTNEAAAGSGFSVTFDVVATSHVANGVTSVIAETNARRFVWNGTSWYPVI